MLHRTAPRWNLSQPLPLTKSKTIELWLLRAHCVWVVWCLRCNQPCIVIIQKFSWQIVRAWQKPKMRFSRTKTEIWNWIAVWMNFSFRFMLFVYLYWHWLQRSMSKWSRWHFEMLQIYSHILQWLAFFFSFFCQLLLNS